MSKELITVKVKSVYRPVRFGGRVPIPFRSAAPRREAGRVSERGSLTRLPLSGLQGGTRQSRGRPCSRIHAAWRNPHGAFRQARSAWRNPHGIGWGLAPQPRGWAGKATGGGIDTTPTDDPRPPQVAAKPRARMGGGRLGARRARAPLGQGAVEEDVGSPSGGHGGKFTTVLPYRGATRRRPDALRAGITMVEHGRTPLHYICERLRLQPLRT